VDILINAAGGNHPSATTKPDLSFFDLPLDAFRHVGDLNLLGTFRHVRSLVAARQNAVKRDSEHLFDECLLSAHAHPGVFRGEGSHQ
jgi:NAD(P)-dependent dehydrogenase (short-subunit alcohol dehydrogenase family)